MSLLQELANVERSVVAEYQKVAEVINQVTRQYGVVLMQQTEYDPFHYVFFREIDFYMPEIDFDDEPPVVFRESHDPDAIPLTRALLRARPELDHMVVPAEDIKVSLQLAKEITDKISEALL